MGFGFRLSINTTRKDFHTALKLVLIAWMKWGKRHCLNTSNQNHLLAPQKWDYALEEGLT